MKETDRAKAIAAFCFRNTNEIESVHAGITPVSVAGDFSDVFVVDAAGNKIPWNAASRISQDEMKAMMQIAVDRVYAVLSNFDNKEFEENVLGHAAKFTAGWDDPSEL